jgi:hypothetical protein
LRTSNHSEPNVKNVKILKLSKRIHDDQYNKLSILIKFSLKKETYTFGGGGAVVFFLDRMSGGTKAANG